MWLDGTGWLKVAPIRTAWGKEQIEKWNAVGWKPPLRYVCPIKLTVRMNHFFLTPPFIGQVDNHQPTPLVVIFAHAGMVATCQINPWVIKRAILHVQVMKKIHCKVTGFTNLSPTWGIWSNLTSTWFKTVLVKSSGLAAAMTTKVSTILCRLPLRKKKRLRFA